MIDPDADKKPTADVVGEILEFFHFKLLEESCGPGEVFE